MSKLTALSSLGLAAAFLVAANLAHPGILSAGDVPHRSWVAPAGLVESQRITDDSPVIPFNGPAPPASPRARCWHAPVLESRR